MIPTYRTAASICLVFAIVCALLGVVLLRMGGLATPIGVGVIFAGAVSMPARAAERQRFLTWLPIGVVCMAIGLAAAMPLIETAPAAKITWLDMLLFMAGGLPIWGLFTHIASRYGVVSRYEDTGARP